VVFTFSRVSPNRTHTTPLDPSVWHGFRSEGTPTLPRAELTPYHAPKEAEEGVHLACCWCSAQCAPLRSKKHTHTFLVSFYYVLLVTLSAQLCVVQQLHRFTIPSSFILILHVFSIYSHSIHSHTLFRCTGV
jgi:hypothetical protein